MNRIYTTLFLAFLIATPQIHFAAVESSTDASVHINRIKREQRVRAAYAPQRQIQHKLLRMTQQERIEKIRSMNAQQLSAWCISDKSDATLQSILAPATPRVIQKAPPAPVKPDTLGTRFRIMRLAVTSALIAILTLLWIQQRKNRVTRPGAPS